MDREGLTDEATEELTEESTEELAEEPAEELAGEPPQNLLRKLQWNAPLQGEGHHLGASETLKEEWSFTCQKKRSTACVEDPVGAETGIQEDYEGDGHGHLQPDRTSIHG